MPWTEKDAQKKTHKADTPVKQRQWEHVANSELASGKSEATAIKAANGVIAKRSPSLAARAHAIRKAKKK